MLNSLASLRSGFQHLKRFFAMYQTVRGFASLRMTGVGGFTLIELVVVITILGILLTSAILLLNPTTQLDKARDSQRQSDLQQVRNALDMYYNDNNSYPSGITFGSSFDSGSTVYMKKLPQDPIGSPSYQYHAADSGSQWAVVYVKLASSSTGDCPLTRLNDCLPQNWDNQWSCVLLGNIDDSDRSVSGPCMIIQEPENSMP